MTSNRELVCNIIDTMIKHSSKHVRIDNKSYEIIEKIKNDIRNKSDEDIKLLLDDINNILESRKKK